METLAFDYFGKSQPVLESPVLPRNIVLSVMILLVVYLTFKGIKDYKSDNGTSLLILVCALIGGLLAEGVADHLSNVYHTEIGTLIAYRNWNKPVPLHIVLAYAGYFAVSSDLFLKWIKDGATKKKWWIGYIVTAIICLLADWTMIHSGLWLYHGNQSLVVWNLPIWIMFYNSACVIGFLTVAHLCLTKLPRSKRYYTLILLPFGLCAVIFITGFASATAIHSPSFSDITRIIWSLCNIGLCFGFVKLCIDYFVTQKDVNYL